MKKLLVAFLTIVLLSSCFGNNKQEEKEPKDNSEILSYAWVKVSSDKSNLSKKRLDIWVDDVIMIYAWVDKKSSWDKNELLDLGKKFISNIESKKENSITENINWGIKYSDFEWEIWKVPQKLQRNLNLDLTIVDKFSKEAISEWTVFVNNVNMWEFKNGEFKKNFKWPMWIEVFNVVVRSPEYGDAFLSLSSLNLEWSLLIWTVKMKKAIILKDFDLANNTSINVPKFKAKFEKCSIVDKNWNCVKEKVDVKINFLSGKTVNNRRVSLNMKALTKEWKIEYLYSWWMAFVDFVKKDWEILKLSDWKTMKITYNVTDEDIKDMSHLDSKDSKEWYWWYDKNRWLWIESDAKYSLDKDSKTWTAVIKKLY